LNLFGSLPYAPVMALPSGFINPCLPSQVARPPSGSLWVHEIKHDGYRLMVRRDASRIRCLTRNGNDWADRFPSIVEAAARLEAHSFLIDGEAVIARDDGMPERCRPARPAADRAQAAARQITRRRAKRQVICFNEHVADDGPTVFEHVCRMGLEGIVSKRTDAPYRSGPSKAWLKSKNPASEAARREREEEWR
jgi:bifunctional non-homologous end joining protein LigD